MKKNEGEERGDKKKMNGRGSKIKGMEKCRSYRSGFMAWL